MHGCVGIEVGCGPAPLCDAEERLCAPTTRSCTVQAKPQWEHLQGFHRVPQELQPAVPGRSSPPVPQTLLCTCWCQPLRPH